ncbi:unnamed protein product [Gordionus sp. m RMFG-2023]
MLDSYLKDLNFQYKTKPKNVVSRDNQSDKSIRTAGSSITLCSKSSKSSSSMSGYYNNDYDSAYSHVSFTDNKITLYDKSKRDFDLKYDPDSEPRGSILKNKDFPYSPFNTDKSRYIIEKKGKNYVISSKVDKSGQIISENGDEFQNMSRFKRFKLRLKRMFGCV